MRALYEVIKANPAALQAINLEKFAEYAAEVGLHYHPVLGLMAQGQWDVIKDFLVEDSSEIR